MWHVDAITHTILVHVTSFPCAVKEFEWRNSYFFKLGDDACPAHNELLRECKEKGLLGFELP
jgi:hypothetical protein